MLPDVIASLAASLATVDVLKNILDQYLATKNIRVEATDKESLAAELQKKAELIRGTESIEEASRSTRQAVERQVRVLEEEMSRLAPSLLGNTGWPCPLRLLQASYSFSQSCWQLWALWLRRLSR